MTARRKVVLMRGARSLAAVVVAAAATWLAGPDAADVIGPDGQTLMVTAGIPALMMLDKWLRTGDMA